MMNNGYVTDEEMAKAFIKADWIVLPYNSATQSGVVIDGYRFGRPCIAFSVGAIAEQVCEGVSGYLIPEGNNAAFADKLRGAVCMSEGEYKKMSQNAYEYGVKKYSARRSDRSFHEIDFLIEEKGFIYEYCSFVWWLRQASLAAVE